MKRKLLLIFLSLSLYTSLFAQQYPVTIIPRVNAPAPVNFYNYADETSLNSPITVQVFLNDLTVVNRQVRLKIYFEGGNINFLSRDFVVGTQDLFIDGGIPLVLNNTELAPYFRLENLQGISPNVYGQSIPEGSYNFCFEIFDFISGAKLSSKTCVPVFIFKNEPPMLNAPFNKTNIEPKDFENIVFQWTPRHINVSNVEYDFSIVEIWDNTVNPQTAFLSQAPIYEETVRTTSILYGPDKPLLLPGRKYAWRVRAKALQGLEEIGMFKNQGYSEVFWFSRTAPCSVPEGIAAEPKGTSKINVFWDQDPTLHSEYIIAYREANNPDANWFTKRTNSTWATIWDLKAGTTYEYKVKGKCTYQYSEYSEPQFISTDIIQNEDANYNCGIVPDEVAISNRDPHPGVTIGDQITAGDFKVTITEIQSQLNGVLSGKGFVAIPYLKFAKFGVTFANILVNTDKQLAEGEIVTLYDPEFGKGASMTVDVNINISEGIKGDNGVKDDLVEVDFVINSVEIDANGAIVVKGTNGEEAIIPGDDDVSIKSVNGDIWSVGEDGKITKEEGAEGGAVNNETTNGLDTDGNVNAITASGVSVMFENSGYYHFDELPANTSSTFEKEYKILESSSGTYRVPYKAISDNNGEDFVNAQVTITDTAIVKDSIVFKTKDGAKVPVSWSGNTAKLSLQRKFDYADEEIFAVVKSKENNKYDVAGSVVTTHLASGKLEPINITLVPLGINKVSNEVIQGVQEIYAKAGVRLNIQEAKAVAPEEVYEWDKNGDTRLEVGDSSLLAHYTAEEAAFNSYIKQQSYYNNKTYYVFVTNLPITKSDVEGFMPLKRQFGFVFTANATTVQKQTRSMAHELGHGVFGLKHTWDEYSFPQGATNHLMDYGNGTVLNHIDWKKMHAPRINIYWFQGDKHGEQATVTNIEGLKDFKNPDGTYTFISRAGNPITLPSDITSVTFSTGDSSTCDSDTKNPFRILPFGTLSSFTWRETNYVARWSCVANTFSGYAETNTTDYYLDKDTNTSITSAIVGFPAVSSGEIVFKVGKISITPEKGGEDYTASGDYEEFDFLANKISEITKYNEIYAKFDPNYDTEVKQFILDHADQNTSESGFYGNNAYLFIHATQLQKHDILKGCFKKGIPGRMLKFIMENKEVFIPSEFGGEWYSYEAPVFSDTYEPETDNDLKLIKYWKDFDLNFYPIIAKAVKAFKIPKNLTSQGIVDLFKDQEHINSPATDNWDCFWSKITIEDKKYFIKTFADDGFLFKGYYDLDSDSEHILLKIFTTTTIDSERDELLTYIKTHKYINYIFSSLDYNSSHSAYFMREIYTWLKTKNDSAYNTQSIIAKNLEFDNWLPTIDYKVFPDNYSTDKFILYGENWYDSNDAKSAAFNADLLEASPPAGSSSSTNSSIKMSQKIRENNSWTYLFEASLIGEFDLYAPVFVKFKSNHFKKYNSKLVEGTSIILPAIYLHWLDKSLERKNNETALRIFADVVAIALAPVTAGGSTLILTVEVTAASIDIIFAVFEDEIAEQLGQESIQTWNAIYGIYNLIYLPQMMNGVYQGGRALFNITTDFVGNAYRIKKINVDYTKLDEFVETVKNLSSEEKLKTIGHITETIKQFKKAGGKYFNTHVYNVMLEARFKILMSIDDTSAILKLDQANFVVSKANISMSVGKVDFLNDIPTITESTRWLPDNRVVNSIAELTEVGFVENGVSKIGTVKILEDVSNPGQFYIKASNTIPAELARGVSPSLFRASFDATDAVKDKAWELFQQEKWDDLYKLFKDNNPVINGGWPPFNGAISNLKPKIGSEIISETKTYDRFQGPGEISGEFASPVYKNEVKGDLHYTYDSRALKYDLADGTNYVKFEFVDGVDISDLKFEFSEVIPWFGKGGLGDQIKSSLPLLELHNRGAIKIVEQLQFNKNLNKWVNVLAKTDLLKKVENYTNLKVWINSLDDATDANLISKLDGLSTSTISKLEEDILSLKNKFKDNPNLIDTWETIIGNPMIRKDIKTLESVSKIVDNTSLVNVISKTDLSNIVNKLAQKGIKCRTCTGGNSTYKYLDEILDDIEFGAVKYGSEYTSVLTGFKQGGNFAEGAMFVASSLKKYPNDFPVGTVFEFTEVTAGGVRRVDVRVSNTFFEFKSVALTSGMPPSGFANQFIKDLQLSNVTDLSQVKWWFDASKTNSLSKVDFLSALENATPSSTILDELLIKFDPTGDWTSIVDLIDDNFEQIFKLK